MPTPLIQIKNLRKVYRLGDEKTVALNHISMEVYPGEICCLLGTSGSGKSTLLNMLAGLEKPSKGEVVIDGRSITSMSEKQLAIFRQANIGFVFQSYNLLATMTAQENVAMPLMFQNISKRERNRRARQILESVGLGKHIRHKPTQMSGGQQQRVGIARAFVNTPKIVFCDEPTGNLDSKTTVEVMSIIVHLAIRHGQTLIIVTHDPYIAKYAHRIVHILDGDIESIELNESPYLPPEPDLHDQSAEEPKKKKRKRKAAPVPPASSKSPISPISPIPPAPPESPPSPIPTVPPEPPKPALEQQA